jgi:hypothetical protein
MMSELTPEQKKELDNLAEVIQTEADIVKQDYEENPSNESGSIVVIHQESPLLKDTKEKLADVAYNVEPKINDFGDDDWATPQEGDENE